MGEDDLPQTRNFVFGARRLAQNLFIFRFYVSAWGGMCVRTWHPGGGPVCARAGCGPVQPSRSALREWPQRGGTGQMSQTRVPTGMDAIESFAVHHLPLP